MASRPTFAALLSGIVSAAAMLVFLRGACEAQGIAVPVETHLPLLVKVIEFDRSFRPSINKVVRLGVVYQKSWRPSAVVFDELLAVASRPAFRVCGFPVEIVPIDVSGEADVGAAMLRCSIDLIYVAPVRGVSLEDIARVSEERHFRTLTGVPAYVEDCVAIGVDVRNDRPHILINLAAAKACGADLSAQILRLARVVE